MNEPKFQLGQTVWIDNGHKDRFFGQVVQIIPADTIKDYGTHYIIEVSTSIGDYLQIRQEEIVYETQDEPSHIKKRIARFAGFPISI